MVCNDQRQSRNQSLHPPGLDRLLGCMDVLDTLVAQAVGLDLDTLEVRYKNGHEEVFAIRGRVGFGIARFPGGIAKRRRGVVLAGSELEIRVRVYDDFGEDAFRVEIRSARRRRA